MLNLLLTLATWSLHAPDVETFEAYKWIPRFTDAADLELNHHTVAVFTHASRHFDPLCLTQPAVNRVVDTMKQADLPTLYLHDQHNENNPAWMYLYRDWRPGAFVRSDVGKIDLNLTHVRHLISLGGYFGQCQRSTVQDAIRCWQRDAPDQPFRITQVLDGIFCVSEYVRWEDPFRADVRALLYDDLRRRHPNSAMSLTQTLSMIRDQDQAIDFLCRQVPPVPAHVNLLIDFFGHIETVRATSPEAPTLTMAYRYSHRFLPFTQREPDAANAVPRRITAFGPSTVSRPPDPSGRLRLP